MDAGGSAAGVATGRVKEEGRSSYMWREWMMKRKRAGDVENEDRKVNIKEKRKEI